MDFERAEPEDSRFFPGGLVSESDEQVDEFVRMASMLTQDELAILAEEVREFSAEQVELFCASVLPKFTTEPMLALVFHCPAAISKLTPNAITKAYTKLYDRKHDCYIRKEFFETSLLKLAVHSSGSLPPLQNFMGSHHSKGDRPEWFVSGAADQAFARRLAGRMSSGPLGYLEDRQILEGLSKFEMPETLGVYVKSKIVSGDAEELIRLIGEMTEKNLLSDKYIGVLREIVGDDLFLGACKDSLSEGFGLLTAVQLVPIYGEEALHDQAFLSGLQWGPNSDMPKYIETFGQINFNEQKLPLLANYVISKMNHVLKNAPDGIRDFEVQVRFCNLAGRIGCGDDALRRLAKILSPPDSNLRQPSRVFEVVLSNQSAPASSRREEAAYKLLVRSLSKLGLETLHRVAPDVSGRFVVDVLDWVPTDLTTLEIIKLFPQAKGSLLENDLGL